MRTLFTRLGYGAGVLLLTAVLGATIFLPYVHRLNREAVSYIGDAVPKIVESWNPQGLVDRATPELRAAMGREREAGLFQMFSKLGRLKKLETPSGTVHSGVYTRGGPVTVGNYTAKAEFENGSGEIKIQLRRYEDGWEINAFRIKSAALLPKAGAATEDVAGR